MSTFEDYDVTCKNYDSQRVAMGTDIIGNIIESRCSPALENIHLLDAGCGTGNYSKSMLDYGIGQVSMIDASNGMLNVSREKLAPEINQGKVKDVVRSILPKIPFGDHSFDAVMFNLVLHHLDREPNGEKFPCIQQTLSDAHRVLKEDGVLCITSIKSSWIYLDWFSALNPDIADRYGKIFPNLLQWEGMLKTAGFRNVEIMTVYHKLPVHVHQMMRNPVGPTIKSWRDTNSYWACATKAELDDMANKIKELKINGNLQSFVDVNDKTDGFYRLSIIVAQN